MGGLRRAMPDTFWTMTVGLLALAAIPPFAGFFSKEAVLGAAEQTAVHHEWPGLRVAGWLVLVVGLATVAVTAAYATRLWLMTFFRGRAPGGRATSRRLRCAGRCSCSRSRASCSGFVGLRADWLPEWAATTISASGKRRLAARPG